MQDQTSGLKIITIGDDNLAGDLFDLATQENRIDCLSVANS